MSSDVGEATEGLENEQSSSPTFPSLHLQPTSLLILQAFRRFTYVTPHSSTLPLFHLRHSSFSNPSFASDIPQDFHLCHLACHPYWLLKLTDMTSFGSYYGTLVVSTADCHPKGPGLDSRLYPRYFFWKYRVSNVVHPALCGQWGSYLIREVEKSG